MANTKKKTLKQSKKLNWKIIAPLVLLVSLLGGVLVFRSFAATKPCVQQQFSQGSRGQCVKYIQAMLNVQIFKADQNKYMPVDGVFGSKTKDYAAFFQGLNNLGASGVVGPKTWEKLCFYGMNTQGTSHGRAFAIYAKAAGC